MSGNVFGVNMCVNVAPIKPDRFSLSFPTGSGTIRDHTLLLGVKSVETSLPREPGRRNHDDTFSRYYRDVGTTKILDAPTERELFLRYQATGDTYARDRIIESCLRFVIKLARRFTSDPERLKDFISAGNMGLLIAIDKYDPNRGTRFLSYATYWVLLYIRNELADSSIVAMPLWRQKTVRRLNREKTRIITKTGKRATDAQLCRATGVNKEQLQKLQISQFRFLPVEETNVSNDGVEKSAIMNDTTEKTQDVLDYLHSTETFILRAYYGFILGNGWSLGSIGEAIGVSSERVRQLKVIALGKMRRNFRRQGIHTAEAVLP